MTHLVNLEIPAARAAVTDSPEPIRFHLSLNVSSLAASIEFYRALFNQPPAKQHDDYAKFDLQDPPVVFSLVPRMPEAGGALSHLGIRVTDPALLDTYRARLETAGICTADQQNTVCGYSKQDKLWIRDPDGNFWEIYHVDQDIPPESVRQSLPVMEARIPTPSAPTSWEHFIASEIPDLIPHDDESLDEVRLTGTFNANVSEDTLRAILRESERVLKPGGKLVTHGLMGNVALKSQTPDLPGLASLVQKVPCHRDVVQQFREAGFVNLEITKFTERAWFEIDGVGLREVKICGYRPHAASDQPQHAVLYSGPFARLVTDHAGTFLRGQRVKVSDAVWMMLRQVSSADSFVFFEPGMGSSCSTSGER